MRTIANLALVASAISFVVGFISKVKLTPVPILPCGLSAETLLIFANTCLLVAITCLLLEIGKGKK